MKLVHRHSLTPIFRYKYAFTKFSIVNIPIFSPKPSKMYHFLSPLTELWKNIYLCTPKVYAHHLGGPRCMGVLSH